MSAMLFFWSNLQNDYEKHPGGYHFVWNSHEYPKVLVQYLCDPHLMIKNFMTPGAKNVKITCNLLCV